MSFTVRETFFRTEEWQREPWTLPADAYNRTRHLLQRAKNGCAFVPIRSMQYLAVIDAVEIIFIDGTGEYSYRNGQGGRLIQIAWQHFQPQVRDALTDPVPCELVYYHKNSKSLMQRIFKEFPEALIVQEQRHQQDFNRIAQVISLDKHR